MRCFGSSGGGSCGGIGSGFFSSGFGLGGSESYPGVFGDFGGFADDARIANGALTLSDRPGIGFEGQSALYRIMRELAGL